jgi:hypothetical protein
MGVTSSRSAGSGILPRPAHKRSRQSRATFVAPIARAIAAPAHPCAGSMEAIL